MSKLCTEDNVLRAAGNISVNKILFVQCCMISLCLFIIPVRIQSFLVTFDMERTLSETFISDKKKKRKKKKNKILSLLSAVVERSKAA